MCQSGKAVLRKQLRRGPVAAFFWKSAAVRDGYGGVRQRPSLGAPAAALRAHSAADGAVICEALREVEQKRCRRRRLILQALMN